jgi:hypothetical protein
MRSAWWSSMPLLIFKDFGDSHSVMNNKFQRSEIKLFSLLATELGFRPKRCRVKLSVIV